MDPIQITTAALAFAGSCVVQKCADASLDAAWTRIAVAYKTWSGIDPGPEAAMDEEGAAPDAQLLGEAEVVFGLSSSLRRARFADIVLDGARILWVDDRPENNAWERSLLRAFKADVDTVETTRSALMALQSKPFDLVISDIAREDDTRAGLRALPLIRAEVGTGLVVFYVGRVSGAPPPGAFGITNDPNELLHLVLDALERHRL
jgi:CheY-like chemotaxis protein